MAVAPVYLCSVSGDVLMLCFVPTLVVMYSKRGLIMSIKLHELNCVEVNGRELGSMRAAAGWSLVASLRPFLHFTASSSHSLSSPSSFSSFAFTLAASRFSLARLFLPLSFFLRCPPPLSPSSLALHYWYRTHPWIFPISRELMTSLSLCLHLFLLFICLLHL